MVKIEKPCKCKNCDCEEIENFHKSFDNQIPYTEQICEGFIIREFSSNVNSHLLKWHKDEEDRLITPIKTNDWQFQLDNHLPHIIKEPIFIPKGMIHRIIKGTTDLYIKIEKNANNPTGI